MARQRPETTGKSEPRRFTQYAPGAAKGGNYRSSNEKDLKLNIPKREDPFDEDKHIMSREPVSDYGFVLHDWKPTIDLPFTTEWDNAWIEGQPVIEFRVVLRTSRGRLTVISRCDPIEMKAEKETLKTVIRKQLEEEISAKMLEFK